MTEPPPPSGPQYPPGSPPPGSTPPTPYTPPSAPPPPPPPAAAGASTAPRVPRLDRLRPPARPTTNGFAVASLVLGIAGFVVLPRRSSDRSSPWSSATRAATRSTGLAARSPVAGWRSPGSCSVGSWIGLFVAYLADHHPGGDRRLGLVVTVAGPTLPPPGWHPDPSAPTRAALLGRAAGGPSTCPTRGRSGPTTSPTPAPGATADAVAPSPEPIRHPPSRPRPRPPPTSARRRRRWKPPRRRPRPVGRPGSRRSRRPAHHRR